MQKKLVNGQQKVTIHGYIERITFFNAENGFLVARLQEKNKKGLTTVVGKIGHINAGESVKLCGHWVQDKKYGEQFRFDTCETTVPATVHGIEKYLGSGLIKGIGPVLAKRIVKKFAVKTLEIIDAFPQKLATVPGIGPVRLEMVKEAWEKHKDIKELMFFLQEYGVGASHCARIYKTYGKKAVSVVKENPYRLAADVRGIGFITADNMARRMGVEANSIFRAKEGVIYVLGNLTDEGHVFCPYELLLEKAVVLLEIEKEIVAQAVDELARVDRRVVLQNNIDENTGAGKGAGAEADTGMGLEQGMEIDGATAAEKGKEKIGGESSVYLKPLYITEVRLAEKILALNREQSSLPAINMQKTLPRVERRLGLKLADRQREAVTAAFQNKMLIITGGPGTGKTTIIRAILEILRELGARVVLTAPTGRAAKRMQETAGQEAKTIHRLLGFNPRGGFKYNEDNPLAADALIVDEASMIDILLMYNLVKAIPPQALLVLVGDVHQLPAVGPGNVLRDLIDSGFVRTVVLNEIFRQSRQSEIVVNAHRINSGRLPRFINKPAQSDFFFVAEEDPERAITKLRKIVCERLPQRFGFNPKTEVQVLAPMHKGVTGVGNINTELQNALNPEGKSILQGGRQLRVGDKVIQLTNDYDKEVFNGDTGIVEDIDEIDQEFKVNYDGRSVPYDFSERDELALAYAISVHKAQGSEYPAVVILLTMQHFMLLQRNLLYTALTRGKKIVVVIGTKKALAIAVKNNRPLQRYSRLKERILALSNA